MARKLITFDWAIKRLLRSKANFGILEGFLSELLKEDLIILEVLESEANPDDKAGKFNRVDLKVRNSKEEIIIIELQYDREFDYLQRIFYSASKTAIEHLKEGQVYSEVDTEKVAQRTPCISLALRERDGVREPSGASSFLFRGSACAIAVKVISINILYFDLGNGADYIYKGTTHFIGIHKNDTLELNAKQKTLFKRDSVAALYPEFYLIKINRFDDIAKDTLDEWIYFLKNEEIKPNFTAKGLKEAEEKLSIMKLPESERKAYESYQDDLHYQASMYLSTYGEAIMMAKKKVERKALNKLKKTSRSTC